VQNQSAAVHLNLFGPAHLAIVVSIPVLAWGLGRWSRRSAGAARSIRFMLAAALALTDLAWYTYILRSEGLRIFPGNLPLELCDVTQWVTVFAACTLNPVAFEIAYYAGVAGSGMAVLTPDLWLPLASYGSISFFLSHGITVLAVLVLLWGGLLKPRPGSWWKTLIILNVYAAAVGTFDVIFKTNYMYLREKPAGVSLLSYLGPWPFYILGGEAAALILLWVLYLPFRKRTPSIDHEIISR
jgi:hypothetical integral membrane protein (TIGR02206 family)